jgi:HEPN domain-containing protein
MGIDIPRRWSEQGNYDLETARAMLQSGRFVYVLFCCQQAVEKMLKGVIAKTTGEMPPRIHNLM